HDHAKNCVKHILAQLPVDPKRVYYTGGSGGGAMAFNNAALLRGAGAMPHIGYIPGSVPRGGHYFIISGATDYNRYTSAHAAATIGKNAVQRFFVGGHQEGPEWLCTEGMNWLNGQYLANPARAASHSAERLDYESAMIRYIQNLQRNKMSHRAYYWAVYLRDEYRIANPNAAVLAPILAELARDASCIRYVEGMMAIQKFAQKYYPPVGSASQHKHTTPTIEKAAQKLAEEFRGVPEIEDLARELGRPTV
ncbi:MAG: hypothetical protein U1E27_08160, partial [Kiritimatiellia bacterium]|nr:hypothetical protein [Kiritimatiellia bacterium]